MAPGARRCRRPPRAGRDTMVSAALMTLAAVVSVSAAAATGEWPGLPSGERLPLMPMPAFSAVQVEEGAPGEGDLVIGPTFRVAVSGRGGARVVRASRRLV